MSLTICILALSSRWNFYVLQTIDNVRRVGQTIKSSSIHLILETILELQAEDDRRQKYTKLLRTGKEL